MKILPTLLPLLAGAATFLLSSCLEKPEETKDPTEEIESMTNLETVIIKDQSGATLRVDCGAARLKAFLSAGTTTNFSVPVRIRFQGGNADTKFRESMEMGPDEESYWNFDEEKSLFEVRSTIAFLESLAEADRLFLEISLSDQDRQALVFDISESDRSILLDSLERNRIRVDNEFRALGLGQYAPGKEPEAEEPDHLGVGATGETLYALYNEYMIIATRLSSEAILPPPTDADRLAMKAIRDPIRPITSSMRYYRSAYPEAVVSAERLVLDAGFESMVQWMNIGDRFQMGMRALAMDEKRPGHIAEVMKHSREEVDSFEEGKRLYVEVVRAFSESELEWLAETRPQYLRAR